MGNETLVEETDLNNSAFPAERKRNQTYRGLARTSLRNWRVTSFEHSRTAQHNGNGGHGKSNLLRVRVVRAAELRLGLVATVARCGGTDHNSCSATPVEKSAGTTATAICIPAVISYRYSTLHVS
ncbi:hypothetical protein J6590_044733 [Homalodisca vitripennis]|nr:hypothetical protein J6590_044733 [Homalodisca vitripennis]